MTSELDIEKNKTEIRRVLSEAVFLAESPSRVHEIRSALSEKFALSPEQVSSIGAWTKIKASQVINELKLDAKITREQLMSAHYCVFELQESSEEACGGIITSLNILKMSPKELLAACEALNVKLLQSKRNKESKKAKTEFNPCSSYPSQDQTLVHLKDNKEKVSALTNFNFPAKNFWREQWIEFLKANVAPMQRNTARVLCLPGFHCEKELEMYRDMGFKAENLIAVESENLIWQNFEEKVKAFGSQPVFGDVAKLAEKGLPPFDKAFDVVALDFLGPASRKSLITLRKLPVTDNCFLMVNQRCARENLQFQLQMNIDYQMRNYLDENPDIVKEFLRQGKSNHECYSLAMLAAVERAKEISNTEEAPQINQLRELSISSGNICNLGAGHPQALFRSDFYQQLYSSPVDQAGKPCRSVFSDIEVYQQAIAQVILSLSEIPGLGERWHSTLEMLSTCSLRVPNAKSLRLMKYRTEAQSKHYYFSQFAHLVRPLDRYDKWLKNAMPIVDVVLNSLQQASKVGGDAKVSFQLDIEKAANPIKLKRFSGNQTAIKIRPPKSLTLHSGNKKYKINVPEVLRNAGQFMDWNSQFLKLSKDMPPIEIITL